MLHFAAFTTITTTFQVGKSDIAGFGCFIAEPCEKGEFIAEYTGEVITHDEAERRGMIYDEFKTSYIFG